MTTHKSNLIKSLFKKVIGIAALGVFFSGGILASAADLPAFNNTASDYPTLMVSKVGGDWGNSVNATPGEIINLFVWDHNTVVNTTATNVTINVNLGSALASSFTPSATVKADTGTPATGTVAINVGSESKLTYIPGTAKFLRNINNVMTEVNWPANVTPDNVVTTGVNVGSQQGCWQYAQAVKLQVRIDAGTAAINTNKNVELAGGADNFGLTANGNPGDAINFKVLLQNTGTGTGVKPQITDTLDNRLAYLPNSSYILIKQNNADARVNIDDSLIKIEGQKLTWQFANMAPSPDAALYLIFQTRLADKSQFPVGTTTLTNIANSSFVNVAANTNPVTITVTRQAEPVVTFSLRKEVSSGSIWYDDRLDMANPGDTIFYKLTAINTGNTPALNVTIKDILPTGVIFMGNVKLWNSANPNGKDIAGDDIVKNGYNIGTLNNGTLYTTTMQFTAKLADSCSGTQTLVNNGQIIYNNAIAAHDDATVIFTCTRGLNISKMILDPATNQYVQTLSTPVHEGQVLTYRILVYNTGNTPATNPVLKDVLPNQITYVNNSLSIDAEFMSQDIQNGFVNPNQGITLTNLETGHGKTIIFQVRVVDCPPLGDTSLTNTAKVAADGIPEVSDSAGATVRVNKPTLL